MSAWKAITETCTYKKILNEQNHLINKMGISNPMTWHFTF